MMRAATLATLLAGAFAVPKVLEERRALQASCWSGAFTEQRCCSGDGGDSSCWGGEFTFSHCCPATGGGRGGGRGGAAATVCVNDDSTTSSNGFSTCSSWYDANPQGCGLYDDRDFTASVQCCACGGSGRGHTATGQAATTSTGAAATGAAAWTANQGHCPPGFYERSGGCWRSPPPPPPHVEHAIRGGTWADEADALDPAFIQEVGAAMMPDASGTHHLLFRSTYTNREGIERCGEVDAAPYMPDALFEPGNLLALVAYAEVTIRLYVNPNSRGSALQLGGCEKVGYTVHNGETDDVSWFGAQTAAGPTGTRLMADTCEAKCNCGWDNTNLNMPRCQDVADDPAAGSWCSLCGPSTSCPGCRNGYQVTIDMYVKPCGDERGRPTCPCTGEAPCPPPAPPPAPPPPPPPPPEAVNQLYFYYVNPSTHKCGEVNAALYMPARLFEPQNVISLAAYVEATTSLYTLTTNTGGFGPRPTVTVQLGRCADQGYARAAGTARADWIPSELMAPTCNELCNCRWSGQRAACHGRALDNPDTARLCSLPYCDGSPASNPTVPVPPLNLHDNPTANTWCSLCNPELAPNEAGGPFPTLSPGQATIFLYAQGRH